MRHSAMCRPERSVVWNYDDAKIPEFCVGYMQLFNDESKTVLKSVALLACSGHVVPKTSSTTHHRLLIEEEHTAVYFIPVKVSKDWINGGSTVEDWSYLTALHGQARFILKRNGDFSHESFTKKRRFSYYTMLWWKFRGHCCTLDQQVLR